MPNTLVHIAVQSPGTRLVAAGADPKWIYLACILPDVPWIVQRGIWEIAPQIDPVQLRYYVDAQGSLLGTLLLCAAVSLFARTALRTFALLGGNALLHLLIDTLEIKWANGVHFLAPFSWEYVNVGLVWPEHVVIMFLTLTGIIVLAIQAGSTIGRPLGLTRPSATKIASSGVLLALYFLAPLFLLDGPHQADNHSLRTLSQEGGRAGATVEFDRARYVEGPDAAYVVGITRDSVLVEGMQADAPATVSLRGEFVSDDVLQVRDYRVHPRGAREAFSIIGVVGVLVVWLASIFRASPFLRRTP